MISLFPGRLLLLKPGLMLSSLRTLPSENFQNVADQFTKYGIQGLLIVGGFEVRPIIRTLIFESYSNTDQKCPELVCNKIQIQFLIILTMSLLCPRVNHLLQFKVSVFVGSGFHFQGYVFGYCFCDKFQEN